MKVGDIVKRVGTTNDPDRYVLVEHHGVEGTVRRIDDTPSHPGERVRLSELVLAENAPRVVDPADD